VNVTLSDTPVLETDRLTLRAPVGGDWKAFEPFAVSERAWGIGGPLTSPNAWRMFCHGVGHWVARGFGMFVYCRKGEDRALGMCGPWRPVGWPENEIGWMVWDPAQKGKGLAREAAARTRDFAFDVLGWQTAVSYIMKGNDRSVALAKRLGAVLDPSAETMEITTPGLEIEVYRHPKPETRS